MAYVYVRSANNQTVVLPSGTVITNVPTLIDNLSTDFAAGRQAGTIIELDPIIALMLIEQLGGSGYTPPVPPPIPAPPYKDLVRDYGASGSANTYTGSMTAGSNVLTLTAASDFQVGQGIVVPHAGGGPYQNGSTTALLEAPTGLTIATTGTAPATGVTGYTYEYYVVAINERGGISGLSAPVSVTITESALSQSVYNTITVDEVTGASTYGLFGAATNPTGSQGWLGSVNPGGSTIPIYDRGSTNFFATQQPTWVPDYAQISSSGLGNFLSATVSSINGSTLILSSTALTSSQQVAVYHNDEAALSQALAGCNSEGIPLYIPSGTFNVWNGVYGYGFSGLYVFGSGDNSVIQQIGGSITNTVLFGALTDCTFRDFVVDGGWDVASGGGQVWNSAFESQGNAFSIYGKTETDYSYRVRIERVTARNVGQSGIRLGMWNFQNDPTITATPFAAGCKDSFVVSCAALNCHDQGIAVWACDRVSVLGNVCDGQCYAGISLTASNNCYVGGGNISKNQLWSQSQNKTSGNHHGYGAEIESGYGNVIENNIFANNQRAGVFIHNWFGNQKAAVNHAVRNNAIVYDNTASILNTPTGVYVWVPGYGVMSDIDVSQNQIYWAPGVVSPGGGWGVSVTYNTSSTGSGFSRITINDNHIINPPNNGIYTNAENAIQARGNTISGGGNPAIQETNPATGNLYEANNVTNNSNGFFAFASGSTSVARNNPGYNPVGALAAPAVGASPWTYTNSNNVPATLYLSGGTVTEIAQYGTALGLTAGAFALEPGQSVTVTYTAAPTVALIGA